MITSILKDIGEFVDASFCGAVYATAGGAGDNSAVTGAGIDCNGYSSGKVVISYTATLTSAKAITIAAEYAESDDDSTYGTATELQAATTEATAVGGGQTKTGVVVFNLPLSTMKRYVKINFTPNLTATGTDTAIVSAVLIKGGKQGLS